MPHNTYVYIPHILELFGFFVNFYIDKKAYLCKKNSVEWTQPCEILKDIWHLCMFYWRANHLIYGKRVFVIFVDLWVIFCNNHVICIGEKQVLCFRCTWKVQFTFLVIVKYVSSQNVRMYSSPFITFRFQLSPFCWQENPFENVWKDVWH